MINLPVLHLIYKEIMLNVIDFNMNYFYIIYYVFIRRIQVRYIFRYIVGYIASPFAWAIP